jgi:hypothetical protein
LLAVEEATMRAMLSVGAIVGAGLMSAGAASPGDSASVAPVHVGDRVRVSAPSVSGSDIRGTLVALDAKTLILAPERKGPTIELSRSQVERLQVLAGKKRNWLAGAVVGAGAGLVLSVSYCGDPPLGGTCDRMQVTTTLGAIGAAGGALFGALIVTDRWKTVPANAVAVSVFPLPVRQGMGLGVRIGF